MDQWLEEIRAALPELVVYQQEPMKNTRHFAWEVLRIFTCVQRNRNFR